MELQKKVCISHVIQQKFLSNVGENECKINALERLWAMANFELVKLRTEPPKSKYDFSTLPGIDDICMKTIIPYLSNDIQALVCLFAMCMKNIIILVQWYETILHR